MYLVFVFPKGQYESKYGSESDCIKNVEKQNIYVEREFGIKWPRMVDMS